MVDKLTQVAVIDSFFMRSETETKNIQIPTFVRI